MVRNEDLYELFVYNGADTMAAKKMTQTDASPFLLHSTVSNSLSWKGWTMTQYSKPVFGLILSCFSYSDRFVSQQRIFYNKLIIWPLVSWFFVYAHSQQENVRLSFVFIKLNIRHASLINKYRPNVFLMSHVCVLWFELLFRRKTEAIW